MSEIYANVRRGKSAHPLEISVNDAEAMHILQTICNICQLHGGSVGYLSGLNVETYKGNAICIVIFPNKLGDVPIVHPFGNHCKLAVVDSHPKKG